MVSMMHRAPTDAQAAEDSGLSYREVVIILRYTKGRACSSKISRLASQVKFGSEPEQGRVKERHRRTGARERSLQSFKEMALLSPDIVIPLLEAFKRDCIFAVACIDTVNDLGRRGGNRCISHHQSANIATIEDVLSILLRHKLSITAIYPTMEVGALGPEPVCIVPPALTNAWENGTRVTYLVQSLRKHIELGLLVEKVVYILPPHSPISETIAVCAVTLNLCFILLVGKRKEGRVVFYEDTFFTAVFPSDYLWDRFSTFLPKWK